MHYTDHARSCEKQLGQGWPEVHEYLDQYAARFGQAHRVIFHHAQGVNLIAAKFGQDAAEAARLHIREDFGFVPESPADMEEFYFPVPGHESEIAEMLENLYGSDFDLR